MLAAILKMVPIFLISFPNLLLAFKIITRPHIHTIFNISLSIFFTLSGICGPILLAYNLAIFEQHLDPAEVGYSMADCARFIEMRHLIAESVKIISSNIMFRFFFIEFANRGFVNSGLLDTKIFKICFITLTLALTLSGYISIRFTQALAEDYPKNTIIGRICLNLRLDWDTDNSKSTSDIYIKPRLIIIAFSVAFGCLYGYLIRRVRTFIPSFCSSNTHHACIGGKQRRNILTFQELSYYLGMVICYVLLEVLLVFFLYQIQDNIETKNVFFVFFIFTTIFDMFIGIIIPIGILYRSQENYPIVWTNYRVSKSPFFTTRLLPLTRGHMQEDQDSYSRIILVREASPTHML